MNDLAILSNRSGADPRAIMAAALSRPLNTRGSSLELDPDLAVDHGGGMVIPGRQNALVIPAGNGALVNKVTPEQLIAIVASIICNAANASDACVALRTEVAGWKFQQTDGSAIL